ncbi:MAG TPA: hypothetical protein VEU11_05375, partial [Terriglobales bacterium]|nr:hypothetical protein [Terriglobales bacterium]
MKKPLITKAGTPPAPATESPLTAPHGLNQIISVFGDINDYVGTDGQLETRWQLDYLERVRLPFPLRMSW